jgi:hypothetical protein
LSSTIVSAHQPDVRQDEPLAHQGAQGESGRQGVGGDEGAPLGVDDGHVHQPEAAEQVSLQAADPHLALRRAVELVEHHAADLLAPPVGVGQHQQGPGDQEHHDAERGGDGDGDAAGLRHQNASPIDRCSVSRCSTCWYQAPSMPTGS